MAKQIVITSEDLVAAFAQAFPREYEITQLRLVVQAQGRQLDEHDAAARADGSAAEGVGEPEHHHQHPHPHD